MPVIAEYFDGEKIGGYVRPTNGTKQKYDWCVLQRTIMADSNNGNNVM
jgi:hypothetical protein